MGLKSLVNLCFKYRFSFVCLAGAALASSCSIQSEDRFQTGIASWYGTEFDGLKTASGLVFDQNELTAAHPSLPLGSRVAVTHLKSGRVVEVTITDRGPFVGGRVIDLSRAAARALGLEREGTAPVTIERIDGSPIPRSPTYTLQLGSFRNKENALKLQDRADTLLAGRYRTEIATLQARDHSYYRVRVGQFLDRQQAHREARRLAQSGLHVVVVER
jgi:rare lipoprotein A